MSKLKIVTNDGKILDLIQGTDEAFYITRQIHDIESLQTRNADFTKVLKIPATASNLSALNESGAENDSDTVSTKIPVSISLDEIMVAPTASLLHVNTVNNNDVISMEVVALYGNFNMFDSLLGGSINQLNWADLAVDWETAPVAAIAQNDTGIVYAVTDWNRDFFHISNGVNDQDINRAGFWVYGLEIITRILSEAGFGLTVFSAPQDFYDFALACPIDKFVDPAINEGASVFAERGLTGDVVQAVDGTIKVNWNVAVNDLSGLWVGPPDNWFLLGTAQQLTVSCGGFLSWDKGHPNNAQPEVRIKQNGITVATYTTPTTTGALVQFFISASITGAVADTIYVDLFLDATRGAPTMTLDAASTFSIATLDNENRTIQPSEHIPKINKKEFFTALLAHFHLLLLTDDISNQVYLYNFDEVYTNKEQDWSDILDIGSGVETAHAIDGYGQSTHFKYLEVSNLFRDDYDYNKRFLNEILSLEVTAIQLPYGPCDRSPMGFSNDIDTSVVPQVATTTEHVTGPIMITFATDGIDPTLGTFLITDANYQLDFNVGDYISPRANVGYSVDTRARRIIEKVSNLSGKVDGAFGVADIGNKTEYSITKYGAEDVDYRCSVIKDSLFTVGQNYQIFQSDGLAPQGLADPTKVASFDDSLTWSEIINNGVYKNLMLALETPQKISAWFNISTAQFVEIDFTRPVYIKRFGAFYYIDRINQFKAGFKTKVDLIRISST